MAGLSAALEGPSLDEALTDDLLLRVFDCLGAADLLRSAALVCPHWRVPLRFPLCTNTCLLRRC